MANTAGRARTKRALPSGASRAMHGTGARRRCLGQFEQGQLRIATAAAQAQAPCAQTCQFDQQRCLCSGVATTFATKSTALPVRCGASVPPHGKAVREGYMMDGTCRALHDQPAEIWPLLADRQLGCQLQSSSAPVPRAAVPGSAIIAHGLRPINQRLRPHQGWMKRPSSDSPSADYCACALSLFVVVRRWCRCQ